MYKTFVVLVSVVLTNTTWAFAKQVQISGRGTVSCELYSDNTPLDRIDEQWILAFLSGYAVASGNDVLSNSSHERIFAQVQRVCRLKNKLNLVDAVAEVARSLSKQELQRYVERVSYHRNTRFG